MELASLTEKIIGAAIEVQRELGPGFLESIYENALCFELRKRGLTVDSQLPFPVYYQDQQVGEHRLDMLVGQEVVVELKATKELHDIHFAQVRSYLKATNLKHGLLFNFSSLPLTIKRVIRKV